MVTNFRRLGFVCLAACGVANPAAGQNDVWHRASIQCGCGFHGTNHYTPIYGPLQTTYHQSRPSVIVGHTPVHIPTQQISGQYYTADEAQVLYHPVVIPLEEFLSPRQPVALTPDQLVRQRAAGEARSAPAQPPPGAPPAGVPEGDPFADDAAEAADTAAAAESTPAAEAAEEPAEPAEPLAEEDMPAEQPEDEPAPEAEESPESEPADPSDDPFNIP